MLATLVIGLREGLEAALIVGMIAAFLRRNGVSLKPMWLGVGAAALLSALVGVILEVVSAALPQQQQEAMETVIGAVAVVIVTFMILWMSKNSRSMKSTLEAHAGSALKGGSVLALAGMAFLAVLREGVETAVFMVAAFQSSLSPLAAGMGAVLGLGIASGIGFLLFRGAIKLNLAKFFKATGVFLVFVAAGLVMKSLRTAHEAGWVNVGQDLTVNLAWLAPNGSARAAILTGVFGIPSDPRLVELLGWALYLIPMLAFILWPATFRPAAVSLPRLQFIAAGALGAAALTLIVTAPLAIPHAPLTASSTPITSSASQAQLSLRLLASDTSAAAASGLQAGSGSAGSAKTLIVTGADGTETSYPLTAQGTESHAGRTTKVYTAESASTDATEPSSLTVKALAEINGGRMPVGISASNNPGPFAAAWTHQGSITLWLVQDSIVDAINTQGATLTLSGGGLSTPRTVTVSGQDGWAVPEEHVTAAVSELNTFEAASRENVLWSRYLPAVFVLAAIVLLAAGRRNRRQLLVTAPSP
ncbi:ferrous iron transporter [Arthrobacter psychrolactophilus]|uniref:Ferrous iron transporter n=1 Tax=Arthrobacter psychrolactophilus TaxID=92442 RepID=A0A2V5IQG1_9MICC|nr:iron uptake transporter permease EfeU [Arthrobacter psychrolactophilus]PYI38281.1 ferrous iron transporter [Arthrobacter psychrolactophilus]